MKDPFRTNQELLEEISILKQKIQKLEQSESERKWALEALTRSEEKFRKAFYTSPDSVNINRLEDGMYISINPGFTRILGYTEEEIIGKTSIEYNIWDNIEDRQRLVARLKKDGKVNNLEAAFRTKTGDIRYGLMSASVIDLNGVSHILSITRDITDRKRGEEKLQRSEAFLNKIIEESPNPMWISDENGSLIRINQACCNLLNITAEEVVGKYNVLNDNVLEEQGLLPLVTSVFEEGKTVQFDLEYQTRQLKQITLQREKSVVLNSTIFPIRGSSGKITNAVIQHIDITDRRLAEENLKETLKSLRKAFETNVQVMASTVEARDPYTAGHQLRVADLACAIATKMGLSKDRIEGIRMAGSVHDIGKLSIPSEILSKPGKLSDIELSMIKEHSQKGHKILKDVESPWPLAEIVYQHHERMDGSGYPRNLKGKEILMESRILAVADVVESMASYRPYRPALGIDTALKEIGDSRGILYDADVVDTCLRLFRETGFQLEGD